MGPYKRNKTAETTNGHRLIQTNRSHTQRSSSTNNNAYGHKKILKKNDKKKQEEKYRRKNNESAKESENEAISHENLEQQLRQKQQNKKEKESNELTMDFFDKMIVPNDDEMDEFINSFAPKMSLLGHGDAASKSVSESKSSSHLIDLKQIRDDMPKKLLLKKKNV